MTPSQTRAVAALRRMIVASAFADVESIRDDGARRVPSEEEISGSKYEFSVWKLTEDARGGLFLYVQTRLRTPQTVGHLFPRAYHFHIGPRGAIRELGVKTGGAAGRRVGLRDYVMGR